MRGILDRTILVDHIHPPCLTKATEFTRYRLGWSKSPSVRASSFGFLSPSSAGPQLGEMGVQLAVRGAKLAVKKGGAAEREREEYERILEARRAEEEARARKAHCCSS